MNPPLEKTQTTVQDLTPEDVNNRLNRRDCLLIGVREPGEFEAERIPGALFFPLLEFDQTFLPFDGEPPVILHYGTGKRSRKAVETVHAPGVYSVAHLDGGIAAWKKAVLPTIQFDPSTGKWRRSSSTS